MVGVAETIFSRVSYVSYIGWEDNVEQESIVKSIIILREKSKVNVNYE